MSDAETIAASLTEAQRRVLLQHNPYRGLRDRGWLESTRDPHSYARAGRVLKDLNLIRFTDDLRDSRTVLTVFGKVVSRKLSER